MLFAYIPGVSQSGSCCCNRTRQTEEDKEEEEARCTFFLFEQTRTDSNVLVVGENQQRIKVFCLAKKRKEIMIV